MGKTSSSATYQTPVWLTLFGNHCLCESLTIFPKNLKTFYFQSAFSGAP